MPRATKNRWPRAARAADLLHRVEAHRLKIQARIARLTPLILLRAALEDGSITSEFFVQRLIDSGVSIKVAMDELRLAQHSAPQGQIADLKPESQRALDNPPLPSIHRTKVPAVRNATLPTHAPQSPP